MRSGHRRTSWQRSAALILVFSLITSCASSTDLEPVTVSLAASGPTPTPFQPQAGVVDSPYLSPLDAQAEPTYTPYPTPYIPSALISTPSQNVTASSDAGTYDPNNPLTGLAAADPALLNRRPMAVKIANAPDYVRPQSGLSLADVVYEYYIEWGETRFIAVFYSNDTEMAGPVRSGRYFDEHITRMYHSYLVFKYADPREYNYLLSSDLAEFLMVPGDGACPPYVIGNSRRDTYNNIFFNSVKFADCLSQQGLDNSRQSIRSGFFSSEPFVSPLSVNRIYFRYSPQSFSYWEYDAPTHKYFRYQEEHDLTSGKPNESYLPLIDAMTNLPVNTDNVVALFVPHLFANHWDAEDEVYHIELKDSGNAFVFRDGTTIPARWVRTDMDQPLILFTLDGTPIYLRPGRTFYEVLGETSTYEQNGTDWRFRFVTP
ncbi:MAG: DUF3048 domain-containing protein [Chloroflexota bacterium]